MINMTQLSCFALRVKDPQTSLSDRILYLFYIYLYMYTFFFKLQNASKPDLAWLQLITFRHAFFFLNFRLAPCLSPNPDGGTCTSANPVNSVSHVFGRLRHFMRNCAPECYFCVCVLMFPSWVESLGSDSL